MALDTGGADAARPYVERAGAEHPSLVDPHHVLDELLGVVNVPMAVWVDEGGMIVRPPHVATPSTSLLDRVRIPDDLTGRLREMLEEARKIRTPDPERYLSALRDWVARGSESPYALAPDEVVRRSAARSPEAARAAACFELGSHLWTSGHPELAVPWFREAHRLQPDNWTYKRQAWQLADPLQGPTDLYDGDWLTDVKKIGAEHYYAPLDF